MPSGPIPVLFNTQTTQPSGPAANMSDLKALYLPLRLLLTLVTVGLTSFVCRSLFAVNASTAGFAFLINVLAIAALWGFAEASLASITAMLCYNYFFLPPIGQFTIADPQNWVALCSFLATALVASQLSNRARLQTLEAKNRQRETEQLYALSRAILLTDAASPIGQQAAHQIAQIFECRAVALHDARSSDIFLGGPEDFPDIGAKLKQVALQGSNIAELDVLIAAVTLGGHPIGSLALKCATLSDGALQAILNLVAIALERVRTQDAATRAEVALQSEEFKSTLLDAIAHEFRTPLTSIKAATSSILSDPLPPALKELTTIIDEEADRLNLLVTEAVRLSQIDAGKVRLERKSILVPDLVNQVLQYFGARLEGRDVTVQLAPAPALFVDIDLLGLALRQLIDNALKFSPPGSEIRISSETADSRVFIRVRDRGNGVSERDRERVFEKFYRRSIDRERVPGSGMGLHIAREILRAHGGDAWTEDAATFCIAIPVAETPHE